MKAHSGGRNGLRILLVLLVLLAVTYGVLMKVAYQSPAHGKAVGLDAVYRYASRGEIVSATLLDENSRIIGERCASGSAAAPAGNGSGRLPGTPASRCTSGEFVRFNAPYPSSNVFTNELIRAMTASGAKVVVDPQHSIGVAKLLVNVLLPLLMLANLFGLIFLSKSGDNSLADIAGFGGIGRKRARERRQNTDTTFANVAGADEAVTELKEVTDYLKDPKKFEAYGASAPKGVLLFGPPGCGKTLLARAAAGESGVAFFSMSGAEFVESLVGVGAARVRDLFRQVREVAPAIVFIDEIDAVGRKRGGEGQTGGEREQTVNQLLIEMDGFEVTSGIVLMGATNRPDILDPALMRPGRFDRHITLEAPDIHGRKAILELHAAKKPMGDDVDFEFLARRTPGFTGADLANVINEGALLAIREGEGTKVNMEHLKEAIFRVVHGPQRRGKLMTPEERRRIAFHEAGHALVAASLKKAADVQRVSIVARGKGLGQSVVSEEAERVLLTDHDLHRDLAIAMGGMAAEQVEFGNRSTTAEDDIEKATSLAKNMVGRYGMSDDLGPVRILGHLDSGFLGEEVGILDALSGKTMERFDEEVRTIVLSSQKLAMGILLEEKQTLDRLASQLLEEETLEGAHLAKLLSGLKDHRGAIKLHGTGLPPSNGSAKRSNLADQRLKSRS